ncbi:MAG: carbon-nitrogen hydrolase family protein [Paracoccus sp. (in: a-proteobacteria)]|uniref:carbon-nitrogen hydrolase family protein n=1 Tax=Paracoccus sp. TaxID=267 RepID=UPI0026DFC729|nr:carbon-nitrogen hydrolase family protein [Paracoccus sp. (in: a-proteobacteria)]MDO5621781.1 carbon-nitrogen hydrolase family protein [Paracoccus sp. (in: a-proteobacteria)]
MRVALAQLCVSDDMAANLALTQESIAQAAAGGAQLVLTPEATNLLTPETGRLPDLLHPEDSNPTLAGLRQAAARHGIWLAIGSLLLRADHQAAGQPPFVNRSFLIDPTGRITARYDKIHMFDVDLPGGQSIRESARYQPGDRAVLAQGPGGASLGLTICYDLRFPHLYRSLAQAGAQILLIPAAFHPLTGAAHWHTLLRARAIETGCFVLAAAQTGRHPLRDGASAAPRESYGHALAVDPWGKVLADAGATPGVMLTDLDLRAVKEARSHIPALDQTRAFIAPQDLPQ